jgi:hypothetical protein
MIVAAALCPSPPLLASALTGQAEILPDLRHACTVAVARLIATAPDVIAVVGPADLTATWDPAGLLDLTAYAPALARRTDNGQKRPGGSDRAIRGSNSAVEGRSSAAGRSDSAVGGSGGTAGASSSAAGRSDSAAGDPSALPLALGIGALLLDRAGYDGPRALWSIGGSAPPAECARLGQDLAAPAERIALLVMGDGSARRSESAPGYLDERAEPFDAEVERAVRDGDMPALAALDPALAHGLMAAGRPAWQVLAAALGNTALGNTALGNTAPGGGADGGSADDESADDESAHGAPRSEILYSAAPFGVAYLVATVIPAL